MALTPESGTSSFPCNSSAHRTWAVIAFESRWHLAFFPFIGVPVCTGALYHDGWDGSKCTSWRSLYVVKFKGRAA
jgi:hypothetical protein